MTTRGPDLQAEIYAAGAPPKFPVSFEGWESTARSLLSDGAYGYIAGGAGAGDTMRANREAFYRRRLQPRMLRDVGERDLSVELLGMRLSSPLLLASVGVLSIAHPDADVAVARAACVAGVPMVLSTVSCRSLEEVATVMGDHPHWFQLYPGKDRDIMTSLIRRAEAAGYGAIVVTLDTPMLGWRESDLQHAYLPFMQFQGLANYLSDPVFRARLSRPPEEDPVSALMEFRLEFGNPSLTWPDIDFLRRQTQLPLLLKGILHPDDAREAVHHDIDGIVVSNHGGRQVDGAIAALDALPSIREAVDGRIPLLFDSGIRRGADILKAVALGASAVLLGRPYVYGLAVAGEAGVTAVVRQILADLDLAMALCGYRAIADVDRSILATER